MAERPVGVTDLASGAGVADIRTRERSVGGNTVAEQYVIPISERVVSYKGTMTSFRTPGRNATTQVLFSFVNKTASGVLVALRRLSIQCDTAAVTNTSWANLISMGRLAGTVPANGTVLAKQTFDSSQSSDANVEGRGDSSADGTSSASALTGTPAAWAWREFVQRMHTVVGQVLLEDEPMIPILCEDDPLILRPNEGIAIALNANASAANGTTVQYLINCMWEEFTLP